MESYCGKNCMQCSYFIQRCCPGCKWGPGQPVQGVCPLARCCREKGHGTCRSCSLAYHCGLLAQRDFFPPRPASSQYPPRQVRPASIPQVPPPTVEKAAILSRWLGWLFFLELAQIIFAVVIGVFLVSFKVSSIPPMASLVSNLLIIGIYCIIYFRLSEAQSGYRIPAIAHIVCFPLILVIIFFPSYKNLTFYAAIQLIDILITLAAECFVYQENGKAIQGLSGGLARGWKYLYVVLICLTGITFFGGLLCFIDLSLGVLPVLMACFGIMIEFIVSMVLLHKTVNTLLGYISAAEQSRGPSL